MTDHILSDERVDHIAHLARIPVSPREIHELAQGFNETLAVVDQLAAVDVSGVEPTHQVTGLQNILREDAVDETRMLSQEQALANAPRAHNGYFAVDRILNIEF